jgi:hypothetical protein
VGACRSVHAGCRRSLRALRTLGSSPDEMVERIEAALEAGAERAAEHDRSDAVHVRARAARTAPASGTPSAAVPEQLDQISTWIRTQLPGQAQAAGASREQIGEAETRSGLVWPAEVRELFRTSPEQLVPRRHTCRDLSARVYSDRRPRRLNPRHRHPRRRTARMRL